MGEYSDVLDGSGFGETVERSVQRQGFNKFHVYE